MHILDSTLPFLLDFGSDYIPPWMVWVYPKPPGDGFGSSKEPGLKTHRLYNVSENDTDDVMKCHGIHDLMGFYGDLMGFYSDSMGYSWDATLWLWQTVRHGLLMAHRNRWFTELKNCGSFHGYVCHNQMVYDQQIWQLGKRMATWVVHQQYKTFPCLLDFLKPPTTF